jgi:hypothetical protein
MLSETEGFRCQESAPPLVAELACLIEKETSAFQSLLKEIIAIPVILQSIDHVFSVIRYSTGAVLEAA